MLTYLVQVGSYFDQSRSEVSLYVRASG